MSKKAENTEARPRMTRRKIAPILLACGFPAVERLYLEAEAELKAQQEGASRR